MQSAEGRLQNIDALRGACVILVFLAHAGVLPWLAGRVGVAAFFLVSGYVIPFSVRDEAGLLSVQKFWVKRFFRLWPAYWCSIAFALMMAYPSAVSLSSVDLAINMTMLQEFIGRPHAILVYWTLTVELCFYAVIACLLFFGKARDEASYYRLTIVFGAIAAAAACTRFWLKIPLPVAVPIAMTLMCFSSTWRFRRLRNAALPFGLLISLLIFLVATCLVGYADMTKPEETALHYVGAYVFAIAIFLTFEKLSKVPTMLVFLGTISYSFYLLHEVVIYSVRVLLPDINSLTSFIFAFALSVAVSAFTYFLIERPAQKFGRLITNRQNRQKIAPA